MCDLGALDLARQQARQVIVAGVSALAGDLFNDVLTFDAFADNAEFMLRHLRPPPTGPWRRPCGGPPCEWHQISWYSRYTGRYCPRGQSGFLRRWAGDYDPAGIL